MEPLIIKEINSLLTGNIDLVTKGYFLWPIPSQLSPGMVQRLIDIYRGRGWKVSIIGGNFLKFEVV